jgi:hypothetical protein
MESTKIEVYASELFKVTSRKKGFLELAMEPEYENIDLYQGNFVIDPTGFYRMVAKPPKTVELEKGQIAIVEINAVFLKMGIICNSLNGVMCGDRHINSVEFTLANFSGDPIKLPLNQYIGDIVVLSSVPLS